MNAIKALIAAPIIRNGIDSNQMNGANTSASKAKGQATTNNSSQATTSKKIFITLSGSCLLIQHYDERIRPDRQVSSSAYFSIHDMMLCI